MVMIHRRFMALCWIVPSNSQEQELRAPAKPVTPAPRPLFGSWSHPGPRAIPAMHLSDNRGLPERRVLHELLLAMHPTLPKYQPKITKGHANGCCTWMRSWGSNWDGTEPHKVACKPKLTMVTTDLRSGGAHPSSKGVEISGSWTAKSMPPRHAKALEIQRLHPGEGAGING